MHELEEITTLHCLEGPRAYVGRLQINKLHDQISLLLWLDVGNNISLAVQHNCY